MMKNKKKLTLAIIVLTMISCIKISEKNDGFSSNDVTNELARIDSLSQALSDLESRIHEQEAQDKQCGKISEKINDLLDGDVTNKLAHIGSISQALSTSESRIHDKGVQDENPYLWLSQKKYDDEDFWRMGADRKTLRIWRNAIYARHGYIFKSSDLCRHFSKFDWYKPLYHTVTLTDIETHNVMVIKSLE